MSSPRFHHPSQTHLIIEHLSDGSIAVFDGAGDAVHSLNATAAGVWQCCAQPSDAREIAAALNESADVRVDVRAVEHALGELFERGLLEKAAAPALPAVTGGSRREALRRLAWGSAAAAAWPVVLTLTGREQRLLAQGGGSTLLNLTGCWMGTTNFGGEITWLATQSGNNVTGPITVQVETEELTGDATGTATGTISGATVTLNVTGTVIWDLILTLIAETARASELPTVSAEAGDCAVTGTLTIPAATDTALSGSFEVEFGDNCDSESSNSYTLTVTLAKGCSVG